MFPESSRVEYSRNVREKSSASETEVTTRLPSDLRRDGICEKVTLLYIFRWVFEVWKKIRETNVWVFLADHQNNDESKK